MIRQQHSFHRLYYHLVFTTKDRRQLIETPQDEALLFGALKAKADGLDSYIEEVGSWYDHAHLLIRTPPSAALSKIYGQLKGFAARTWNMKRPEHMLGWSDGVFAATVDPDENDRLREYIRNQRTHHAARSQVDRWEPTAG